MFLRVLLPLAFAGSLMALDCPSRHAPAPSKNDAARKMFDRLKSLAGDWEIVNADADQKGKIGMSYRVTAGGSAVMEVIFPGTDMEMVSMYYCDGKDLVLTHYCMLGNQPRMRAKVGDDANRLVFEFAGGSNLDPAKDPHIHGGVIQFVDDDRMQSAWDYYAGGKRAERHSFEIARKR